MTSQQRMVLAILLCGAIFFVSQWLFPPPAIEAPPGGAATEGDAAGQVVESDGGTPSKSAPSEAGGEDEAPASNVPVESLRVENEWLALELSNDAHGERGIVEATRLRSAQFENHETGEDPFRLGSHRTLAVSFADAETDFRIPRGTVYAVEERSDTAAVFQHVQEDVEIRERLEILGGYQARLEVTVTHRGDQPIQNHRLHLMVRVGVESESRYDIQRGLCRLEEEGLEEEDRSDVEDEAISYRGKVLWGGVDSKYFGTLVVPDEPAVSCELELGEDGETLVNDIVVSDVGLAPGESYTHVFGLYLGPKELDRLKVFSAIPMTHEHDLEQAVDWGYLGAVSESLGKLLLAMLRWFHAVTGDWGWSIVMLTVVVKILILPLTLKQNASMKAMKRTQPLMAEIREKYADDRAKQAQEMQALYAREGVNPLAGCLPMLALFPVYIALYAMLGAVVELVHVPFLWLPDLTQQDPYYVLPVALGGMMVLQQRIMPVTGDDAQVQMMRWMMPLMFTAFMLFLPSGLGVYIFVNIALSVVQTMLQLRSDKQGGDAEQSKST